MFGIKEIFVEDLRETFVRDYVFPMFRANALYEGVYLLGTSIARPLIAKRQIEIARETGADAVAHGATGKGNDQVRFELGYYALDPDIKVISPWREWDLTSRTKLIAFAEAHQIPIAKDKRGEAPFSVDANLLHISAEGKVLEDPWVEPRGVRLFSAAWRPRRRPTSRPSIEIEFERRRPGGGRRHAPVAGRAADQAQPAGRRQRHRPARPGGEPLRRHEEPGRLRDPGRHGAAGRASGHGVDYARSGARRT